jgi:multiple sugar transport system ATP-binding protein
MVQVNLQRLRKTFGAVEAVKGLDLTIDNGEFIVFVGPSGCGKTTALRMVAGLEDATSGQIWIDGKVVNDLGPRERDIAMVFQNYALYPHMTVYENLAFCLQMRKFSKEDIRRRIEEVAGILNIAELLSRKPSELSGGQRQRVAVGRAIVRQPKLFLFDEPLSNLDAKLRAHMRAELKRLHYRLGATAIYVTHDQVEAMTLGDRVVVMRDGVLQQVGAPLDIYARPANVFVAGFIGSPSMNLLRCRASASGDALSLEGKGFRLMVPADLLANTRAGTRDFLVGLRPESLTLRPQGAPDRTGLAGTVEVIEPLGAEVLVTISVDGQDLVMRAPANTKVALKEAVHVAVDPADLHFFDPETGRRLETLRA